MKLKARLLVFLFSVSSCLLISQAKQTHRLAFQPMYGDNKINLHDSAFNSNEITIETMKFYISSVELLKNNKAVWKEKKSFHLVDASNVKSLTINLPEKIVFDQIQFNLGIDSVTNVSGAMGGDLDPTRGMYWTWQNGYINFKVEGKSKVSKSRNGEFQFHLGGYQSPFATLQRINLYCKNKEMIVVNVDIGQFLRNIDLSKQDHLMSPGQEAVEFSKTASQIFSVKQ